MNRNMRNILSSLILLTALVFPAITQAAPTVTVVPTGDASFAVMAADFQNVGGLDFTIRYDTSTLANPRVALGSLGAGVSMVPNTGLPAAVRVAMIKFNGISGSGSLVTITFDRVGTAPGNILSINMNSPVIDANGRQLQASFQVVPRAGADLSAAKENTTDAGSSGATSAGETATSTRTTETGSSTGGASGGTSIVQGMTAPSAEVTPPAETTTSEKAVPSSDTATPEAAATPTPEVQAGEEATGGKKSYTVIKGVRDKFRDFRGEKTPDALIALVTSGAERDLTQDPPVVLTDGKTKMKITLKLPASGRSNPDFALTGARLVNLKLQGDSTWLIEVMPEKGALQASLKVMTGQAVTEYPLTVAPPVETNVTGSGKATSKKDFAHFLKERGTEKKPRFDLDGDGRRTYIDDYIYTLNYVVGTKGTGQKSGN